MINSNFLKKVKVTEFTERKSGSFNPVLVSFLNGEVSSEYVKKMKASFYLNDFGNTRVKIETPNDQVFKAVNSGPSKIRQFIAIHNKKTHKMRIIEVDSALMVNADLMGTDMKVGKDTTDSTGDSNKLNKTFGSKKIASRLHQKDKLNVSSSATKEKISEVVKEVKVEDIQNLSNTVAEADSIIQLLPPCNRSAPKPSDVYLLSDILNHDELEELKAEASNRGLEKTMDTANEYSKFFQNCYSLVKMSKQNTENLAAILFMEVLIKFLKAPIRQLRSKRSNFCPFSSLIYTKVIDDFCIKTGTLLTCPASMRDKVLCYIMVIGLICCNYEIDLKILAVSTSAHLKRLTRLARVVGMVPVSTNATTYKLKVPLPSLPKSSIQKTKRRA